MPASDNVRFVLLNRKLAVANSPTLGPTLMLQRTAASGFGDLAASRPELARRSLSAIT